VHDTPCPGRRIVAHASSWHGGAGVGGERTCPTEGQFAELYGARWWYQLPLLVLTAYGPAPIGGVFDLLT
jgi:hypothetical protein